MTPALVLALMLQHASPKVQEVGPPSNPQCGYDGWCIYTTTTAGYDAMMNYKFKRTIFVAVGPPESVYPDQPAPEVYIRYANLGVTEIVSVPEETDVCNVNAPVYIEYGGELFHNCPPWGHQ